MRKFLIETLFCLVLIGNAAAAPVQNLEDIRSAVHDFAVAEVGGADDNVDIKVGRLDPRLRLAACSIPLETYFAPGSRNVGHTTVGVRCEAPKAWSLFVPLHIDRMIKVAVATDNIPRGQLVGAGDVAFELRSLGKLRRGYFEKNERLIGRVTTRSVPRGTAYTDNMVKKARMVRRGERVVLALHSGTVAVRVAGTAMRDGSRGERIPVRNLSSKRIVEGVVHEPGLVLVGKNRAKL